MKIESIFGDPVVRIQCEDRSLWKNSVLNTSIEMTYNSPVVINRVRESIGDSHKGAGLTTVGQPYPFINLPGATPLKEWVKESILKAAPHLGLSGSDVFFKRSWTNRLFKGGYGQCHRHTRIDNYMKNLTGYTEENFRPDAVAIFYADVPEHSSNLVFIQDGADDTYIEDYPVERQHWLQPIEGELVIHSPDVWHAVSVHKNDIPRNVFVFDVDIV